MRILLAILVFFICFGARSQNTYNVLSKVAFDHFLANRLDSALHYYQQCLKMYPEDRSPFILRSIAYCYKEQGDMDNAEKFNLLCLEFNPKDSMEKRMALVSQSFSSAALADLYYEQGKFQKALEYLEYSVTKYKSPIRRCFFGYETRQRFFYKKALCYSALGQKQKAFDELAPWMFREASMDDCESEEIARFFVTTAFEVYGEDIVRSEMLRSLNEMTYIQTFKKGNNSVEVHAEVALDFFGINIPLNFSVAIVKSETDMPEDFKKEAFLAEVKSSPAYKLITEPARWINY